MKKRLLSALLTFCMLLTLLPVSALAVSDTPYTFGNVQTWWGGGGDYDDHWPSDNNQQFGWQMAEIERTNRGYRANESSEQERLKDNVTVQVTGSQPIEYESGRADIDDALESGITITPTDGYYVKAVIICCNDGGGHNCATAARGDVYAMINTDMTTGEVVISARTLKGEDTGFHRGAGYPNWVMVELGVCPSPVYVQYDFNLPGAENLSVDIDESNSFNNTTAKYEYTQGSDDVPTHDVLPLLCNGTKLEKTQTVEANGNYYTFDGWKAQYYMEAKTHGDNLSLSGQHGDSDEVNVGHSLRLQMHVKLTAQWKEVEEPSEKPGTPINVEVYVNGKKNNASYYLDVDGQSGTEGFDITSEPTADTITFKYTYLQYNCADIIITPQNADNYVVQAISADLIGGTGGSSGIQKNGSQYTLDNVNGGSTVKVYLYTPYTVAYYENGEPSTTITDTTEYVAGGQTESGNVPATSGDTVESVTWVDDIYPSTVKLEDVPENLGGWYTTSDGETQHELNYSGDAIETAAGENTVIECYARSITSTLTVEYYYEDAKGTRTRFTPEDVTTSHTLNKGDTWTIKIGEESEPPATHTATATVTRVVDGKNVNYMFDAAEKTDGMNWDVVNDTITGEMGTTDVTVKLIYTQDEWKDSTPDEETGGDGIPDKYQALVKFEAKENGSVSGPTPQVFTLGTAPEYATSGTITPAEVTATANSGFAFDIWTKDAGEDGVNPFTEMTVNGGDEITFYAHFAKDVIGGETPGGDGTPDKYQATVTYEVVGGTWENDGTADIQKVFTLKTRSEAGQWVDVATTPTLEGTIPQGMKPDNTHVGPGDWSDPEPIGTTQVTENVTYTYTFPVADSKLTIDKKAYNNGTVLDENGSVNAGDTITYQITVKNEGNTTYEKVTVRDAMMTGSVTIQVNKNEAATQELDGTYTTGELKPGDVVTLTYTYTTKESDAENGVKNTAVAFTGDTPSENDPKDSTETFVNNPDVGISKTVSGMTGSSNTAVEGDTLTYTITVRNKGNTKVNAVISDDMWTYGKVSEIKVDGTKQTLSSGTYTVQGLEKEKICTITYTYEVTAEDVENGVIQNAATADIDGDEYPDAKIEIETETGEPSLSVNKTADKAAVKVGDTITYTVEVKNNGAAKLDSVVVSDPMMTGTITVTYNGVSSTATPVENVDGSYTVSGLEKGEFVTITYTAKAQTVGQLTNTVTVTSDQIDEPVQDTTTTTVTEADAPSMSINKEANKTTAQVGDTVTYTITVTNTGNVALNNVTVTDTFTGVGTLTFTGYSAVNNGDGTYTITIGTLAEGATASITATYTVLDGDEDSIISNTAIAKGDQIDSETPPATETVTVSDRFTLIYDANGGSFSDGAPTLTIPNLSAGTYILTETQGYTAPTYGKYVLIGWSTAPSGSVIGAGEEIPDCIPDVTLSDDNPTQTVYAVWGEDANGDGIADAQQIVIRPADITIYTGGDGYEGVVNGSNGEMTGSSTNHGLPEPGYYLVLPYELNEDLRDDPNATGAVDLSQHLRFSYGPDRIWELELYNPNSLSMAYDYYIYQMVPQVAGQDPVRLEIKDGDTYVTDDDFTIALDTLYQEYEMKLYTGEVEASGITVQISVNGEDWKNVETDEANGICPIEGTLTVRGTNGNDPVTSIESSVTSPVDVITAEAGNVTYYINDSDIPVVNQDDVALLSDELVGAGVSTLLDEAEDRLGLAWYEDYEYQTQYLDLVDTSNGNAYVTLGAGDSVDIHWPMPNGTSRWDTDFYVVHFDGLDRNFDDLDAQLNSGNVDLEVYTLGDGLRIENGNLVFTTDTFSPFVLIWQDSGRDWPDDDDDDDDDNDRPNRDDDDDDDGSDAPELDKESHIAYVSGTPEGTIEPDAYITREEVATIFFRLLTDRSRANYITDYNPFPDVDSSRWSFYPIVTMNNAGIMHGYNDGSFAPSGYITRAEFAVVAAQFSDAEYTGADLFSDISGHWAREYINRAASEGWISGYPDGSFGPDDYITRAQVMALVNEVLDRAPDADYMLDDMITWPDNADESAWYYEDVQEATNSHSYVWRNSGRTSEEWEDLIDTRTLDELVRDAFNGVGISY